MYDPADPFGKMFFNILASFAEFERDIIRLRTIEGMATARQSGRLKGKRVAGPAAAPGRSVPVI